MWIKNSRKEKILVRKCLWRKKSTETTYHEKLECPFCMKKYKSQIWLDKHIEEKHGNEEYTEPELRHEKHERHKKTNSYNLFFF